MSVSSDSSHPEASVPKIKASNTGKSLTRKELNLLSKRKEDCLFLRDLPFHYRDDDLHRLMVDLLNGVEGDVELCRVKYSKENGKTLQIGIAKLRSKEIADEAMARIQANPRYCGRDIRVSKYNSSADNEPSHIGDIHFAFQSSLLEPQITEAIVRAQLEQFYGPMTSICIRSHFFREDDQNGFGFFSLADTQHYLSILENNGGERVIDQVHYKFSGLTKSEKKNTAEVDSRASPPRLPSPTTLTSQKTSSPKEAHTKVAKTFAHHRTNNNSNIGHNNSDDSTNYNNYLVNNNIHNSNIGSSNSFDSGCTNSHGVINEAVYPPTGRYSPPHQVQQPLGSTQMFPNYAVPPPPPLPPLLVSIPYVSTPNPTMHQYSMNSQYPLYPQSHQQASHGSFPLPQSPMMVNNNIYCQHPQYPPGQYVVVEVPINESDYRYQHNQASLHMDPRYSYFQPSLPPLLTSQQQQQQQLQRRPPNDQGRC